MTRFSSQADSSSAQLHDVGPLQLPPPRLPQQVLRVGDLGEPGEGAGWSWSPPSPSQPLHTDQQSAALQHRTQPHRSVPPSARSQLTGLVLSEPSQEGVIPAEFRTHSVQPTAKSFSPEQDRFSGLERKAYHNWSSNPVEMWSKEQVRAGYGNTARRLTELFSGG